MFNFSAILGKYSTERILSSKPWAKKNSEPHTKQALDSSTFATQKIHPTNRGKLTFKTSASEVCVSKHYHTRMTFKAQNGPKQGHSPKKPSNQTKCKPTGICKVVLRKKIPKKITEEIRKEFKETHEHILNIQRRSNKAFKLLTLSIQVSFKHSIVPKSFSQTHQD